MVSAPRLRGRPLPSSDPTPGLARRAYGRVDAAPGCRIGDRIHTLACSSHAGTPTPGRLGREESRLRRTRGTAPGGFPTEGVAWDPICTLEKVATLASAL